MAESRACQLTGMVIVLYIATTVILYIALNGNHWVSYHHGHSGFWNNCNATTDANATPSPSSSSDDNPDDNCHHIHMYEASGALHVIRAAFVIGYIVWWGQVLLRYMTWNVRGSKADKIVIMACFSASGLCFTATFLYTFLLYDEEFVQAPSKYLDASFAIHHTLAYLGSSLATIIGILNIRYHAVLNSKACCSCSTSGRWPGVDACTRRFRCRRCRGTRQTATTNGRGERPTATQHSESSLDASAAATRDRTESSRSTISRGRGLFGALSSAAWAAGLSGRSERGASRHDRDSVSDELATVSGAMDEGTSGGSGASTRLTPIHLMPLPPAYDAVMRDYPSTETVPPPTYYEATEIINQRELILSPPPAYCKTVT